MATFLFDEIIFGPIQSRRLGTSLGINLLPTNSKFCNFNCVYCECGWTPKKGQMHANFHSKEKVIQQLNIFLQDYLSQEKNIDTITFAGNGEPTLHPHFKEIIEETILLRNKYYPKAKVSVLSNATMLHSQKVIEGLLNVDNRILKLDSAIEETCSLINQALGKYNLESLKKQFLSFNGDFIIQTMFLKGKNNGKIIDNTSPKELKAYKKFLSEIKPQKIMIYTLDRDTPSTSLEKISKSKLLEIKQFLSDLNIPIDVAG